MVVCIVVLADGAESPADGTTMNPPTLPLIICILLGSAIILFLQMTCDNQNKSAGCRAFITILSLAWMGTVAFAVFGLRSFG